MSLFITTNHYYPQVGIFLNNGSHLEVCVVDVFKNQCWSAGLNTNTKNYSWVYIKH